MDLEPHYHVCESDTLVLGHSSIMLVELVKLFGVVHRTVLCDSLPTRIEIWISVPETVVGSVVEGGAGPILTRLRLQPCGRLRLWMHQKSLI